MVTNEELQQIRNMPLIRTDVAGEIGDCTAREVRNLLKRGEIEGARIGRAWRVNTQSWLRYLNLV